MLYLIYASKLAAIDEPTKKAKRLALITGLRTMVKAHAGLPTLTKPLTICGHWT